MFVFVLFLQFGSTYGVEIKKKKGGEGVGGWGGVGRRKTEVDGGRV